MRYIKTIDDITKDGQVTFGDGYEFVAEAEKADAILMRSTDLHGYELPESIRAIARCGAGVNNIPIEEYAKKGVVVFNSPGANSNAVKELVLAMLVLSSRGVVQSMNWVRENAADPDIFVNAEKAKKAFVGRELKGKSIAVIGLGNVARRSPTPAPIWGWMCMAYDPVYLRRACVGAFPEGSARIDARGCVPRPRLPHAACALEGRHNSYDWRGTAEPACSRCRTHQLFPRNHR